MNVVILTSGKKVIGMFPDNEWRVEYFNTELTIRRISDNYTIKRNAGNAYRIDSVEADMLPEGWNDPNRQWEYDIGTGSFTEIFFTQISG